MLACDCLAVNPDIVCRVEGTEALLFDPTTERVRVLNEEGLYLWNLCDGAHTRNDLVDGLSAEFPGVGRDVLGQDVDAFLFDLARLGYLRECCA